MTSVNGAAAEDAAANDGDADSEKDLFGMNLLYNTTETGMSNAKMYNGNISAMQWMVNQGLADVKMRGYTFSYDPMNRLLNAAPGQYSSSTWAANSSNREGSLSYDLNGNITGLERTRADGAAMDNLAYDYGTAEKAGNRLLKVKDLSYNEEGFKDNTNGGDDYVYDSNGSMTSDGNKGIGIVYNLLNLPSYVSNTAGERIYYLYDAGGRKLSQIVTDAAGAQKKKTDYHGEYIYENDTLKFANHEEGRIIMTEAEPEYQYHLKDHLGNVRMTYTTKEETESFQATYEDSQAAQDDTNFFNYGKARRVYSQLFDRTNGSSPGYAQRLSGSAKEKIGLARSFSVMPGDKIKAEVYAKYVDPEDDNWSAALETLLSYVAAPATAPQGTVIDGSGYAASSAPKLGVVPISHVNDTGGAVPKAYLNYIFINRNYDIASIKPLATRITEAGKEDGSDGAHSHLTIEDVISEPGYVYVYLSNDGEMSEVYFDDFKVEQVKSVVIQSEDYYPFGLTFNSYQRENVLRNSDKFNGYEEVDDLGLNILSTDFRVYDPATARLWQIDLVDKVDLTPYAWGANNPILFMDIFGLDTLTSTDPNFDWDDVNSGDVVDGTQVMSEVVVQNSRPSTSDGYYWLEGYGYYKLGEKVLGHRDGVPGLEDLFDHRTVPAEGGGFHWIDAEGNFVMANVTEASVEYGPGSPVKIVSSVKKFSDLLKVARQIGSSPRMRAELNKMIRELMRGNFAGRGTNSLGFGGVHEMRGYSEGARVYYRNTKDGIEILAYSDKATQPKIIKALREMYGK